MTARGQRRELMVYSSKCVDPFDELSDEVFINDP